MADPSEQLADSVPFMSLPVNSPPNNAWNPLPEAVKTIFGPTMVPLTAVPAGMQADPTNVAVPDTFPPDRWRWRVITPPPAGLVHVPVHVPSTVAVPLGPAVLPDVGVVVAAAGGEAV